MKLTIPNEYVGRVSKSEPENVRIERCEFVAGLGRQGYSSVQVANLLQISQFAARRLMVLGGWDAWQHVREGVKKPEPVCTSVEYYDKYEKKVAISNVPENLKGRMQTGGSLELRNERRKLVREYRKNGYSANEIATAFQITITAVNKIIRGIF